MKTKVLTTILSFSFLMFASCQNEDVQQQDVKVEKIDVFVNSVKELTNEDNSLYNIAKLDDFDFSKKNVVEGNLYEATRAYSEDKECIFFENGTNKNEVVAFYVDKKYGVEKSAIFKCNVKNDILYVTAYDLDRNELFDIEVSIKTQTGIITNVYTPKAQSRLNGCNAAIYAAGAPWAVGFGMVNPLAGLAAATFFWALEHAVC